MAEAAVLEPVVSPGADLGTPPPDPKSGLSPPPVDKTPVDDKTPPVVDKTPVIPPIDKALVDKTPVVDKVPAKTAATPPADDKTPVTPADFPADWRAKMAGDNKAVLARLERMGSPADVLTSYLALEQRMSAGDFVKKLPNNYTPEELAEYKKANAIPDKSDGYDVKVDGLVWGESDKPLLNSFTEYALAKNLPGAVVKDVLGWYASEQQQMVDRLVEGDQVNSGKATEALRAEWGAEHKPNLNALGNLYAGAPQGMWDAVMTARMPDGTRLGDNPDFLKWQAGLSRNLNPYATLVPDAGGSDPAKTDATRRAEIKVLMADKSSAYWRGAQSEAMQKEYRDILERTERAQAGPAR